MFTTISGSRGRPFGPDGCQVPVGQGTCGETRTLEIINEFKRLYEEKMHEIDTAGGGDCLQEKVKLQQEWISDLSDQNEMLVRAVEELEHEATERVRILEEKLQKSAQCLCEEQEKLKCKEGTIKELEVQIDFYKSFGDVEGIANELKCKRAECENLKTSMADSQQALVEEIASKHDQIVQLKRDCQQLEERCIQADKQTAFRDDIIKELRKEIKQLKQQTFVPDMPVKIKPSVDSSKRSCAPEPYLVINHTRKIVQSGRSTVIYLRKEDEDKPEQKFAKNLKTLYEKQDLFCYNCSQKLETDFVFQKVTGHKMKKKEISHDSEDEKPVHLCRSENDLYDFKKLLRPVKDRSKFTATTLGRCNTFVGSTKDVLKNVDFESRLKQRNVSVPNHVPVKLHGFREQHEEIQTLLEKITDLESENESIKYNVTKSIDTLQEKLSHCWHQSQNVYEIQGLVKELGSIIENLGADQKIIEDSTRGERVDLRCAIYVKDQQLRDQLELIKVLVVKLFSIDQGLAVLEGRVSSVCEINEKNYLMKLKKPIWQPKKENNDK